VRGPAPNSGAAPATVSGEINPPYGHWRKPGRLGLVANPRARRPAGVDATQMAAGGVAQEENVTTQSTTPATTTTQVTGERAEVRNVALAALAFGVALVFTVGFASPSTIHNAAHDTRHALSFPCH
jgi:cobalt transporter subunit CbtB